MPNSPRISAPTASPEEDPANGSRASFQPRTTAPDQFLAKAYRDDGAECRRLASSASKEQRRDYCTRQAELADSAADRLQR